MKRLASIALLLFGSSLFAQVAAAPAGDLSPLKALSFLEGSWDAKTQGGSAGAQSAGTYVFQLELKGHILARHSNSDPGCKGPTDFNCEHSDYLYVYSDAISKTLKAIYFDNEGHVIHYTVTVPDVTTAEFISDPYQTGPQFHLIYQLRNGVMSGKFQVQMPGQQIWTSYLEWSGGKK
jgi:hypothetical protein